MKMRKGFTLIEMLVVIGIIAILAGVGMAGYNGAIRTAQRTKGNELVHAMQIALEQALQKEDSWPMVLLANGSKGGGKMTARVGASLAKRKLISGTYRSHEVDGETVYEMTGLDQYGIVTPWAAELIKRRFGSGSLGSDTRIPSGGTLDDHILRFAVDDDYDGITEVSKDGISAKVRASACVWCCGYDGKWNTKDDIRSWSKDQEVK